MTYPRDEMGKLVLRRCYLALSTEERSSKGVGYGKSKSEAEGNTHF